jgi:hypothetical protein
VLGQEGTGQSNGLENAKYIENGCGARVSVHGTARIGHNRVP